MEEESKKPFGRPSGWPSELGTGIRIGVHAPKKGHEKIKDPRVKKLLGLMIMYPDFEAYVFEHMDKYFNK